MLDGFDSLVGWMALERRNASRIIRMGTWQRAQWQRLPPNRRMKPAPSLCRGGISAHHRKKEASYKEDGDFSRGRAYPRAEQLSAAAAASNPAITGDRNVSERLHSLTKRNPWQPYARWAYRTYRVTIESKPSSADHACTGLLFRVSCIGASRRA